MRTLDAETLTEARRERESLLAGCARDGSPHRPRPPSPTCSPSTRTRARSPSARGRTSGTSLDRHLAALKTRRVQDVTASDARAGSCAGCATRYSPWTCVAVYRILRGTFALALRRGILTRSPIDGLAPSERPKQRNAKQRRRARRRRRWRGSSPPEARSGGGPRSASPATRGCGSVRFARSPGRDVDFEAGTVTRPALAPAGRDAEGAEDGSGNPNGPAAAGAAPPARRLEAPLAADAARRPRRRHRRREAGAGAEPPPRARRCEDESQAGRHGGAAVVALAAALVRLDARDRPRAPGDDACPPDGAR